MRRLTSTIMFIALACSLFMLHAVETSADVITLRSSVRAPEQGRVLRLRDIALLEGAEAEKLGEVVVHTLAEPGRLVTLRLADVRKTLDEAGVNWSRVDLNGREIVIRPRAAAESSGPQALQPVSISASKPVTAAGTRERAEPIVVTASEVMREPTLRAALADLLTRGLRVEAENLRIIFDPRDEELLDLRDADLRFQIDPKSSMRSDRVSFSVLVWRDGTIERRASLMVQPYLAIRAADVKREIARGETIGEDDIEITRAWVRPSALETIAGSEIAGRTAARPLTPGGPIRTGDLAANIVIKRGERVLVRCISGGIAITFDAEARGEGAVGETIELRKTGERDSFFAVVTARGEVVLDLRRASASHGGA